MQFQQLRKLTLSPLREKHNELNDSCVRCTMEYWYIVSVAYMCEGMGRGVGGATIRLLESPGAESNQFVISLYLHNVIYWEPSLEICD